MALPNTRFGAEGITKMLAEGKRLWFIGIGGVHMSLMAELAAAKGFAVAGSDRAAGDRTERLARLGISVAFGHRAERVVGADAVIYTLALSPDNPEYSAARHLGIPVISRADFLSFLMKDHKTRIGVSGCHGKSTVTAMLSEIFTAAGRAPTVFCGAPLRQAVGTGRGEVCLFEACEYEDSFLCFSPTLAVILNVEQDHVDYFASKKQVEQSFGAFAALAKSGSALVNAEDEVALSCVRASGTSYVTFGVDVGDIHARDVHFSEGRADFVPVLPSGAEMERVFLRVVGRHNLANAMAALATAWMSGIPEKSIVAALGGFRGAGRRMEYRGMLRGARLFDDYAHHPSEIVATLTAARQMVGNGRLFAVFQSHTYTRTAAFFSEICAALRLADRVLIADIYAARETDTLGMSAAVLAAGVGDRATAEGDLAAIATALGAEVSPGDLVVVMGAGDIDRIFGEFLGKHFTL